MLITLMSLGIVALNAATLLLLIALVRAPWRVRVTAFIRRHALLLTLLLGASAIAGSLTIEYGAHLPPCDLCWWERVCLYPVAIVALIAFIKNVRFSVIADYVLWLSVLGGFVALYQHLLQMLPQGALIPCSASNECAIRSVFEFGYITLPWMGLSVCVALILVALIARRD